MKTSIKSYANSLPVFRLEEFFDGPSVATGVFQDRNGRIKNRFIMHLLGSWQGKHGQLLEKFLFLDDLQQGSTAERKWELELRDAGHFVGKAKGSAGDILGTAQGESQGYAMHWRYTVRQPVGKKFYPLRADDWMYLLDTEHVINRTRMYYHFFYVGEVSIEIHRLENTAANRDAMLQFPELKGVQK